MKILAEVTLTNYTFTEDPSTVTIEEIFIEQLGNSYSVIEGQVFLTKVTPLSQSDLIFNINKSNRLIKFLESELEFVNRQENFTNEFISSGEAEFKWVEPHLNEYAARRDAAVKELNDLKDTLALYEQYLITR